MLFLLNTKEVIGYIDIGWYKKVLSGEIVLEDEDNLENERDYIYEIEEYCKKFTQLGGIMSDLWYGTKNYDEEVTIFNSNAKAKIDDCITVIFDDDTIGFITNTLFKYIKRFYEIKHARIMMISDQKNTSNGNNPSVLYLCPDNNSKSSSKRTLNNFVYMEKQY